MSLEGCLQRIVFFVLEKVFWKGIIETQKEV